MIKNKDVNTGNEDFKNNNDKMTANFAVSKILAQLHLQIWSILIHCHEENPRATRAARIIQGTLESRLSESDAK